MKFQVETLSKNARSQTREIRNTWNEDESRRGNCRTRGLANWAWSLRDIPNNAELVKVYHSYRIISRILFSLVQSCRKRVEGTEWNTKGKKGNIMQSRFTYRVTLGPGSISGSRRIQNETKSLLRPRQFKISIRIEILAETARAGPFLIIKST